MKRQSLTILVVLFAIVALAGCGIPQEDYDQVVNDLAEAQAEIAGLKTELTAAQNEYDGLQDELDAAVAGYENLQAEYDALDAALEEGAAEYDELNAFLEKATDNIDSAYVYHSIVIELLGPAVTGDALNAPETKTTVELLVDQAGDEGLQKRFDAWSASTWDRSLAFELLGYAQLKLEELVFEMGD